MKEEFRDCLTVIAEVKAAVHELRHVLGDAGQYPTMPAEAIRRIYNLGKVADALCCDLGHHFGERSDEFPLRMKRLRGNARMQEKHWERRRAVLLGEIPDPGFGPLSPTWRDARAAALGAVDVAEDDEDWDEDDEDDE